MDPVVKEEIKKGEENYYENVKTLKDTIDLMLSDDYLDRFVAEYVQTKIRYEKLHTMLNKWDAGTLEFEPVCPKVKLLNQQSAMGNYLNQLEIRAEIEGVRLPRI